MGQHAQADDPGVPGPCSRSLTKTRLPSDLDIFSPSMRTIAWCIQCRTNGSPVAASDWAASHSWCGKMRSEPPPWRSMVVPSSRRARAEHSMCQPGRPGPHSESQAGSSSADGCQRTKSRGLRLLGSSGLPPRSAASAQHLLGAEVADLAEAVEGGDVEVDGAAGLVGVAPVEDHADEAPDVGDGRGGPGLAPAGEQSEAGHVGLEAGGLGRRQVQVVHAQLAGLAQDVVVDVGEVADTAGLVAAVPQAALEDVVGQVGGGVAEVAGVVGRDAARVHEHDRAGLERHDLLAGRVEQPHRRPRSRRAGHSPRSIPVNFTAARVL